MFRTIEAQKKERLRFIYRGLILAVCVSFLVAGALYALNHPFFAIQTITVETNGALSREVLKQHIYTALEGNRLAGFPKNIWLLLPRRTVRDYMLSLFPRIESVSVIRIGLRDMSIEIRERRPSALWCGDIVPEIVHDTTVQQEMAAEEAWGTCFLMDEHSYIYARAPLFTGNMYMRYYGSLDQAQPVGQKFIDESEFSSWQTVALRFKTSELPPRAILFTDEFDVEVYLPDDIRVLMPRKENEQAYTRFIGLRDSDALDASRPVEYIDLRFGTKVFVRYWDESGVDDATSTP